MNEISVKEAAELLKVSEKTIYRWIRQGVVPTFRFQGQYRFDKQELESWARYKRIGASTNGASGSGEERVDLDAAVQRGGIHYKIEGSTPAEIFSQVVDFFPFTPGFSASLRESLRNTLLEREQLVSTAIGHGIALPHPRHPSDWGLGEPAVGIFFLEQPADFQAIDGEPIFVLFVILCSTIKGHLKMLSQISHLVKPPEMQQFLRGIPNRRDLMEKIQHAFSAV